MHFRPKSSASDVRKLLLETTIKGCFYCRRHFWVILWMAWRRRLTAHSRKIPRPIFCQIHDCHSSWLVFGPRSITNMSVINKSKLWIFWNKYLAWIFIREQINFESLTASAFYGQFSAKKMPPTKYEVTFSSCSINSVKTLFKTLRNRHSFLYSA